NRPSHDLTLHSPHAILPILSNLSEFTGRGLLEEGAAGRKRAWRFRVRLLCRERQAILAHPSQAGSGAGCFPGGRPQARCRGGEGGAVSVLWHKGNSSVHFMAVRPREQGVAGGARPPTWRRHFRTTGLNVGAGVDSLKDGFPCPSGMWTSPWPSRPAASRS